MRILGTLVIVVLGTGVACSAVSSRNAFTGGSGSGAGDTGATGAGNSGQGGGITGIEIDAGTGGMNVGTGTPCNVTDQNADMDGDGWTPAQGDCNDCDPNVNPGAIDVWHVPEAGAPFWGNEACDGNAGVKPCDTGL